MMETKEEILQWFFDEVGRMYAAASSIAPVDFAYAVIRKHKEAEAELTRLDDKTKKPPS